MFSRILYVLTEHYGLRLDEVEQLTPAQRSWYIAAYNDRMRESRKAQPTTTECANPGRRQSGLAAVVGEGDSVSYCPCCCSGDSASTNAGCLLVSFLIALSAFWTPTMRRKVKMN